MKYTIFDNAIGDEIRISKKDHDNIELIISNADNYNSEYFIFENIDDINSFIETMILIKNEIMKIHNSEINF